MAYAQGEFVPKHPEKYIGKGKIKYRSSWELAFMQICDNHPNVVQWASESIFIPYFDPLSNKRSIYIPDFFLVYFDKAGTKHVEVIEIKPLKEMSILNAGRNARDRLLAVKNGEKWKAATAWCAKQGIRFKVLNENDLFHQGK